MSRYLDAVRAQRTTHRQFTARQALFWLSIILLAASGAFWWQVQSLLTPNKPVAAAFSMILTITPPALSAFLFPASPAGMLLAKLQWRTWGGIVVAFMAGFFLYYSFTIYYQYWLTQEVARESGNVLWQVLVMLIGFVFVPGLAWIPITNDELVEYIRQAQLVRRYELQTAADIAILQSTLLFAQQQALIGFANLTVAEKEELATIMRSIIRGIDGSLKELAGKVHAQSATLRGFDALDDNSDIRAHLDYVAGTLNDGMRLSAPKAKKEGQ